MQERKQQSRRRAAPPGHSLKTEFLLPTALVSLRCACDAGGSIEPELFLITPTSELLIVPLAVTSARKFSLSAFVPEAFFASLRSVELTALFPFVSPTRTASGAPMLTGVPPVVAPFKVTIVT